MVVHACKPAEAGGLLQVFSEITLQETKKGKEEEEEQEDEEEKPQGNIRGKEGSQGCGPKRG